MEVLLFALFFISALIFFIAGKDDFGRTENKLIIKEEENIKKEDEVIEEGKKVDKVTEGKKEEKVTEKGSIETQDAIKKDS